MPATYETCSRCRASATTQRPRSPSSPTDVGTSCSTPTCAGSSRGRSPASSSRPPSVTRAERDLAGASCSRRRADGCHLVGRGDGARRPGLHSRQPALRPACPVADRCAWRAAGYPAYDGPAAEGADLGRHRPSVPRAAVGGGPRQSDGPVAPQPPGRRMGRRDAAGPLPGEPAGRRARRRGGGWYLRACPDQRSGPRASARSRTARRCSGPIAGRAAGRAGSPMNAASRSVAARRARPRSAPAAARWSAMASTQRLVGLTGRPSRRAHDRAGRAPPPRRRAASTAPAAPTSGAAQRSSTARRSPVDRGSAADLVDRPLVRRAGCTVAITSSLPSKW